MIAGKSLKSHDRICWVTPVGDAPVTGGGVARAVNLINQSGLIKANNGDLISLYGLAKSQQVKLCIAMLRSGYRKFVLHSYFAPFSLFLLCLPFPVQLVVLPHGELRRGALAINGRRKQFFLRVVRLFYHMNRYLKVVGALATTDEEFEVLRSTVFLKYARKASDFLSEGMLLAEPRNVDPAKGLYLVNIARMVPNKGIAHFLEALAIKLAAPEPSWTKSVSGVFLFYLEEDPFENALVVRLSEQIRGMGVSVYMHSGMTPEQIRQRLRDVPNRLGFISSRFESFSYALIESLGFEYRPIVWFENDLVEKLMAEGLCHRMDYGFLGNQDEPMPIQLTDEEKVRTFIARMVAGNSDEYQDVISKTFGVPELLAPI